MNELNVRHAAVAPPAVEPYRLLSPAEVASALDVAPVTVRRWIHAGKLAAVLAGGQWRISPEALETFLNRGA